MDHRFHNPVQEQTGDFVDDSFERQLGEFMNSLSLMDRIKYSRILIDRQLDTAQETQAMKYFMKNRDNNQQMDNQNPEMKWGPPNEAPDVNNPGVRM